MDTLLFPTWSITRVVELSPDDASRALAALAALNVLDGRGRWCVVARGGRLELVPATPAHDSAFVVARHTGVLAAGRSLRRHPVELEARVWSAARTEMVLRPRRRPFGPWQEPGTGGFQELAHRLLDQLAFGMGLASPGRAP